MCPPESDSTVMSSAKGTKRARRASSAVNLPCETKVSSSAAGAGERKGVATSGRETFANTW